MLDSQASSTNHTLKWFRSFNAYGFEIEISFEPRVLYNNITDDDDDEAAQCRGFFNERMLKHKKIIRSFVEEEIKEKKTRGEETCWNTH